MLRSSNLLALLLVAPWALSCAGRGSLDQGECLTDGRAVLDARCSSCHTDGLFGTARHGAPAGVDFDTEDDVRQHSESIRQAALVDDAMPPPHGLALCERATLETYLDDLVDAVYLPSCEGRVCGDDGCGGSCGSCSTLASCELGACVWQTKSYAADVHPLFQSAGCASAQCHGGSSPKAGLDLSSATVGYAELVDVASIAPTCAGRKFVVPSDVAASYLVNKLSGAGMCAGVRMPRGGLGVLARAD